jgi:hypothetical protein
LIELQFLCSFSTKARVARFFLVQHAQTGKIYQTTSKYPKWPQNMYTKWTEILPNGHKI